MDDGGEVDLDLGNYERFLDITLHRDNNITTGKVYKQVIERERIGDYLGKTVQGEFGVRGLGDGLLKELFAFSCAPHYGCHSRVGRARGQVAGEGRRNAGSLRC